MSFHEIYGPEIPDLIKKLAQTPEMLRLKGAGMDCGCEYTSFPVFMNKPEANRYDHSLGVAMIVWHFTGDLKQSVAGLLHDIATPAFSHVVDFVHGDHLKQESTENETEAIIRNSSAIQQLLREYALSTEEVCDYHRYPLADNDIPRLSADRLEYTLKNLTRYGRCSIEKIREIYADLTVAVNEEGEEEIAFLNPETAELFSMEALPVFRLYSSDPDRYTMEALAQILKEAFALEVISDADLYRSEKEIIGMLCSDEQLERRWRWFTSLHEVQATHDDPCDPSWLRIPVKKRFVDPLIKDRGRTSELFPEYRAHLRQFIDLDLNYWVRGISYRE